MLQGIFDSMLLDGIDGLHRLLAKRGKENLFCPICRRVVYEPVQAPCHHIFCHECLKDKLRKDQRCPAKGCLRASVPLSIDDCVPLAQADPGAEKVRGEIRVKCRLFGRGCRWKGVVRELVPHRDTCRYVTLQCHNVGCGLKMERRFMKDHSAECPHRRRTLRCTYCGAVELPYKQLQQHVEMQCPAFFGWEPTHGDLFVWACPSVKHANQMSAAAIKLAKHIAKVQADEETKRANKGAAEALAEARRAKAEALAEDGDVEAAEEAFVQATVNVGRVANKAQSAALLAMQKAGEDAAGRAAGMVTKTKAHHAERRDARHAAEAKTDIFFFNQRRRPARLSGVPSVEEIKRRAEAVTLYLQAGGTAAAGAAAGREAGQEAKGAKTEARQAGKK